MKLKATLFGIFSLTLFSLGIWVVILFNVDPDKADKLIFIAFLSSLFLWLSGLLTFIEYFVRLKLSPNGEHIYSNLPIAARHGAMLALVVCLLATLGIVHVLNLLDALLLIIIISVSELYFKARPNAKPATQ